MYVDISEKLKTLKYLSSRDDDEIFWEDQYKQGLVSSKNLQKELMMINTLTHYTFLSLL